MSEREAAAKEAARREGAVLARRHAQVGIACAVFVAAMVGVSFAAVPLYDLFCRVTGFGGTPRVASSAPVESLDRRITIRFDSNVSAGLPWTFVPEVRAVEVAVGETRLVHYTASNDRPAPTAGTASYNVSPPQAGYYFVKMQCFCFTEQKLDAGERLQMPVAFYVDPEIENDPELKTLKHITLSYTFFPAGTSDPVAARADSKAPM